MTIPSAARRAGQRLSLFDLLAFSAPAASMGALAVAFQVYLPPFYAGHVGLGAAGVGLVFFLVRVVDIPFDPIIGMVMDRTKTRFGRYRFWLMVGGPVFMLACYAAFAPPAGASSAYIIFVLVAVYIGQSMINLSQTAWGAVIAPTYDERSRMFAAISFVGVAGAAALLLLIKFSGVKSSTDPAVLLAMAVFMIVSAGLGILWAVLRIPETIGAEHNQEGAGFKEYWALVRRPEVLRLMFGDMCMDLGQLWMSALYLYFFESARGFSAGQSSILLFLYIMAGLLGAPLLNWLAVRFGKHRALIGCSTGFSLMLIVLYFVRSHNFWVVAPFMIILGALAIGFTILIRAMIGDVGDQVRLETGKQRMGLLMALIVMVQKITSGFSIILTYSLLPIIGFEVQEGAVHSAQAIHNLELLFLLGPIGFVMLGGVFFLGYKLDSAKHAGIRAALEERDAAAGVS